eukprot:1923200-Rhodomonas_salina.1
MRIAAEAVSNAFAGGCEQRVRRSRSQCRTPRREDARLVQWLVFLQREGSLPPGKSRTVDQGQRTCPPGSLRPPAAAEHTISASSWSLKATARKKPQWWSQP